MDFGEAMERQFLSQAPEEDRSIEQSLDLGWKLLSILPKEELHRISEEEMTRFYGK